MSAINELQKLLSEIKEVASDLQSGKFVKNVFTNLAEYVRNDINDIFTTSIDKYYEAYDPIWYKRTESFYDSYRIESHDASVSIEWGARLMPKTHRAKNTYIYTYMFKKGYHGGADKGPEDANGNPFPGGMALRTPPFGEGTFSLWSEYQAEKTESPEEMINTNIGAYENGEANFSVSNLLERAEYAFDDALSKYALFK